MAIRRSTRALAAAGTLVAVLAACAGQAAPEATQAPYAATDLVAASAVSAAVLEGRPALLTTWATWCEECRDEMPALEALWQERRADGLQVVAVNVNVPGPSERTIGPMIAEWGLTMPQWRDPENRFNVYFGGLGVPMSVLLDADGSVVNVWFGAIDHRVDEVRAAIDSVLAA